MTDTNDKLAALLLDCRDEQKALRDENKRLQNDNENLRTQITQLKRNHRIAVENAHEEGFKAGARTRGGPGVEDSPNGQPTT